MNPEQLKEKAQLLRVDVVRMIGPEKVGHLGGACSLADIVAALYFHVMKHNPKDPKWPDRDRFLLSKGHGALIQYAALSECGYFPKEELMTLKRFGSRLQGHPDFRKLPGIEANTGSLGQGLSIAAGMAAGVRLDGSDARVYCAVGDGEMAEGEIWEAAMAASRHKLDNLCAIIDVNGLQAMGPVAERFPTAPYDAKWAAFGWNVISLDGHDINQILDAFACAARFKGKPTALIARTVKGKGVPFAENVVGFHNGAMTREQYDGFVKEGA